MADGALARTFVAALDDVARAEAERVEDLDQHLARVIATARAAWPTIEVSDEMFLSFVAARVLGEGIVDELARIPAADLYLACACASGMPAALRAFEDTFSRDLDATLVRIGLPPAAADDTKQRLRMKLFVAGDGEAPRIVDYTGRGALGGWLRVIAVREGLNTLRANAREIAVDDSALLDGPISDDPALAHMKTGYRAEFRAAVREAMTTLEPRERNLLRQYHLDGMTLDRMSTMYRVHLATVARWVQKARTSLLAATRRDLMTRLGVDRAELDSILRMIESSLDVSASDLLQE